MAESTSKKRPDEGNKEPQLHKFFRAMSKESASDLHLRSGAPPHIRRRTKIFPAKYPAISEKTLAKMVREILTDSQWAAFEDIGSIDVAQELAGSDRFRINIFRQRGKIGVAVRRVSRDIPTFEQLNLPGQMAKISDQHAGLVLVAGATGAGKSTTIAAMLEHINQTRACHIVTIEDPIEYIYEDKKAIISQREVGIDVPTFELSLKYLMREDPDVVLVGEMRDRDTFQAALHASETGHLVFCTIHASAAHSTITRILDLFEPASRDLARQSLAFNLRAVICQKLLPCLVEGVERVPAVEVLLVNPPIRKAIQEGRDAEILDMIRSSEQQGMQDFTKSLLELIEKEYVDPRVAYEAAPNPEELKMRVKGIRSSR